MSHTARRNHDHDYVQDNVKSGHGAPAHLTIVKQAEVACHLQGNINGPDLGDFEEKYLLGATSFA